MRRHLVGHIVHTAAERGWAEMSNGEMIEQARISGYELLITTDRNIRHQQNPARRGTLAVLALRRHNWTDVRLYTAEIRDAVNRIAPGEYAEVVVPPAPRQ